MNFEKFSERARGFVQAAQTIALRENHQRFLPEHLLKALLDDDQGLAANLIARAGGDPSAALAAVDAALAKVPRVEGGGDQLYMDSADREGAGRGGEAREAGGRQLRHRRAAADGAGGDQVGRERRAEGGRASRRRR